MLPHWKGETTSIFYAFMECTRALHKVDRETLDDSARAVVQKLDLLMGGIGVPDDAADEQRLEVLAAQFTFEQQSDLSDLVDQLANWFVARSRVSQ